MHFGLTRFSEAHVSKHTERSRTREREKPAKWTAVQIITSRRTSCSQIEWDCMQAGSMSHVSCDFFSLPKPMCGSCVDCAFYFIFGKTSQHSSCWLPFVVLLRCFSLSSSIFLLVFSSTRWNFVRLLSLSLSVCVYCSFSCYVRHPFDSFISFCIRMNF